MEWSLFVLILMGQCSLCVCHLYKYHFVKEAKTWEEAQVYCRDKYTDLATVLDMTDVNRLNNFKNNGGEAWIGLRKQNVNKTWHWSQSGVEFKDKETDWGEGEPNDHNGIENCVLWYQHKWTDLACTARYSFICYNESNKNENFHLIEQKKTWQEAQSYCRENHTDLVSGLTQLKDEDFKTTSEPKQNEGLWIGLSRDTWRFNDTWRWSDEINFSFRHWDKESFEDEAGDNKCAFVSNGKWSIDKCNERKRFFCYEDGIILINKSMTWERALTYCREEHYELVSITNPHDDRWVQERAKRANSSHVWVGLRYSCTLDLWFWITDEAVRYKNWESPGEMDDCDMSGAMATRGQHKWSKINANEKFNFICFRR